MTKAAIRSITLHQNKISIQYHHVPYIQMSHVMFLHQYAHIEFFNNQQWGLEM